MFGRPEWFEPRSIGWGLMPRTWQGWVYTAGWAILLAGPFLLLISAHWIWPAVIWLLVAMVVLIGDVADILRQLSAQDEASSDDNRDEGQPEPGPPGR